MKSEDEVDAAIHHLRTTNPYVDEAEELTKSILRRRLQQIQIINYVIIIIAALTFLILSAIVYTIWSVALST